MWHDTRSENLLLAVDLFDLIYDLNSATPAEDMRQRVDASEWGCLGNVAYKRDELLSDWFLMWFRDAAIIGMAGCRNLSHIVKCATGYLEPADALRTRQDSVNAWISARWLKARLDLLGGWQGKKIYLAGHSYGGWVMQPFMKLLADSGEVRSVRTLLYGGPKALGFSTWDSLKQLDYTHWVCQRDPVPFLYPSSAESVTASLSLNAAQRRRVQEYSWSASFARIADLDAKVTDADEPLPADLAPLPGLIEWFSGVQGFLHPAHTAVHYRDRLYRALLSNKTDPYPTSGNVATSHANVMPPVTEAGFVAQPAVIPLTGTRVSSLSRGPGETTVLPPVPAKAKRLQVIVGGNVIGTAVRRSTKRKVERAGRLLLQELPRLAVYDADALMGALPASQGVAVNE